MLPFLGLAGKGPSDAPQSIRIASKPYVANVPTMLYRLRVETEYKPVYIAIRGRVSGDEGGRHADLTWNPISCAWRSARWFRYLSPQRQRLPPKESIKSAVHPNVERERKQPSAKRFQTQRRLQWTAES